MLHDLLLKSCASSLCYAYNLRQLFRLFSILLLCTLSENAILPVCRMSLCAGGTMAVQSSVVHADAAYFVDHSHMPCAAIVLVGVHHLQYARLACAYTRCSIS